jgi:hypothetical protein
MSCKAARDIASGIIDAAIILASINRRELRIIPVTNRTRGFVMRGVGMWTGTPSLMALVACCVVGLVGSPTYVYGETLLSPAGSGSSSSLTGSPLVVQGVQPLDGGQQVEGAEEARRSSPEAVEAREVSQTSHEGLDSEEAARLVQESFPGVVDQSAGGLPQL